MARTQARHLLPLQIAILHGKLNAQARRVLGQLTDLTLSEWRVLRLLGLEVGQSSAILRKAALIDKGQFSRIVTSLIERGLVVAHPSAHDQRQWDLALTPLGQTSYESIAPALEARQEHLTAALTADERRVFMTALDKLGGAAEDDIVLTMHEAGADSR